MLSSFDIYKNSLALVGTAELRVQALTGKLFLRSVAVSLFRNEFLKTTLVKAKELRRLVEPLITLSKEDSVHNRRRAFAKLRDDAVVGKLFKELGPRYKARPGGYLRVLKCGFRSGDKAPMAYVELVDRDRVIE